MLSLEESWGWLALGLAAAWTALAAFFVTFSFRLRCRRGGFSLHAATTATHRSDVEVLRRYILRTPLAIDRLTIREDGNVELAVKVPGA